ncbi:bifunctional diaminohydroxyphosphoribosylaminopyrimidine deaminase/5-amino-6-(5-phosphoribosylamino)uracil reductase RibD [Aureitalea sp. L0-47]|uniref:bifunctional diaminohydroxyphosphoribosylaminopyrimidine deaminase/5-amino-6-(5-phosphoribosylamino)uracil reductase RibD n=1 Tax=Aureitalea sp. L0-47 TaxID=2816962 RepID=UPI0022374B55|nr:bifunctional diaminohydroxyphosphoribosylaminopyrimidine deaminase/5-amino-6-(5-phosphoribosylamino)uracil reductase RibD [Aureitalea sp. L0-47]MCW5519657.1 bifunctional diaminohydroxyphosphoribosylaminopyrimidine deaminase/5-amino-6-(5-phosphoribosylamino)uracil reductase RibD [Aureitalea sp. L0-47]
MKLHEKFMSRCIELAKKGLGNTYPNPLVGSVIVHEGRIIGEGWHHKAGSPHAEINAINSVADPSLLKSSTIYVSLEPCSHFGRTPPCANRIISEGIKKVVIGSTDPNPQVSGNGIRLLKEAGCEVTTGIMEDACDELNKRFFTYQKKHRPYIFLKWAQTSDGFIAPKNRKSEGEPVWISNPFSKQIAHKMRAEEAAILVGTQTVIDDDPGLTTREWKGSNPLRIALDRKGRIPKSAAILDGSSPTLLLTQSSNEEFPNVTARAIDFSKPIAKQVCEILFEMEIQSLIVEGGAKTLQTFIDEELWDEAIVFEGPAVFGEGVASPIIAGMVHSEENIKEDSLTIFKNMAG